MTVDLMHLSPLSLVRLGSAILIGVCAFQMLLLLANYWHNIMPLRREIGENEILAPPVGWTFAYHLIVFLLLVSMCVSRIQLILSDSQIVTFSTFTTPVLAVALYVVTSKFQKYYSRDLHAEARKRSSPGRGPVNSG